MSEMKSLTACNEEMLRGEIDLYNSLGKLSPRSKKLSVAEIIKAFMNNYNKALC